MPLPEPRFSSPQLTGALEDDIPRTFRRERDAREKEAREREAKAARTFPAATDSSALGFDALDADGAAPGVAVSALNIPFFRLMAFFIKALFAAIPALLILTGILWGLGAAAQAYFPWLVKMRILIQFPG
jgi:hypothetical protein